MILIIAGAAALLLSALWLALTTFTNNRRMTDANAARHGIDFDSDIPWNEQWRFCHNPRCAFCQTRRQQNQQQVDLANAYLADEEVGR